MWIIFPSCPLQVEKCVQCSIVSVLIHCILHSTCCGKKPFEDVHPPVSHQPQLCFSDHVDGHVCCQCLVLAKAACFPPPCQSLEIVAPCSGLPHVCKWLFISLFSLCDISHDNHPHTDCARMALAVWVNAACVLMSVDCTVFLSGPSAPLCT